MFRKPKFEFCGAVSVAGINQAWKESKEAESKSDSYDPATFVQTMTVVHAYLGLPWARRRQSWTEYLSFLAKMILDHLAKRPLTPEQVATLATVVLYLNRLTRKKPGELKRLWHDWERLQLVYNTIKQSIASDTLCVGSYAEISLYISQSRMIDDPEKREESLYTVEKILERGIAEISSPCQLAQIFRDYALLCAEFPSFHQDALAMLARSRQISEPFLDAHVKTWMAWPSVFWGRRY
ncbi:MAG: hypothetical protein HQL87_16630 [Magnetococcales bacterium]|nr:hypothetical protein [Magnetococcales bacterium]